MVISYLLIYLDTSVDVMLDDWMGSSTAYFSELTFRYQTVLFVFSISFAHTQ